MRTSKTGLDFSKLGLCFSMVHLVNSLCINFLSYSLDFTYNTHLSFDLALYTCPYVPLPTLHPSKSNKSSTRSRLSFRRFLKSKSISLSFQNSFFSLLRNWESLNASAHGQVSLAVSNVLHYCGHCLLYLKFFDFTSLLLSISVRLLLA